ncbi:hypothetical protein FQA39_LY03846 [Lamprigera yunnana]|nr:hypothetical protein FQA39_LY03846 [Lamprigera yunnana]
MHIKITHHAIFVSEEEKNKEAQSKLKERQPKITHVAVYVSLPTKAALLDACVELIIVNGNPYALMEDSGLAKIFKPIIIILTLDSTVLTVEGLVSQNDCDADYLLEYAESEQKQHMAHNQSNTDENGIEIDLSERLRNSYNSNGDTTF